MFANEPLLFAATIASLWFLLVTVANLAFLRRTRRAIPVDDGPRVSIVLPARNEEARIGRCIESLIGQSYGDYEIIVVDDNSEDDTRVIAERFARADSRVRVVAGRQLPTDWNGKQFACSQGIEVATGELFFLTDADVVHRPDSLSRAVGQLQRFGADFLSGYVAQEMGTLGELLIVPMTYIMTTLLLPLRLLTTRLFPSWGFAIGQYMLVRREALADAGGYEGVKDSLVEDMALSRAVRATGRKTIFVDARQSATCRMYHGYGDAFRGLAKSVFGAVGGRTIIIAGLIVAIAVFILMPLRRFCFDVASGGLQFYTSVLPVALFFLVWQIALLDRGLPVYVALLHPISFANLVILGVISTIRTGFGRGIEWKGRLVRIGRADLPDPDIINAVALYRLFSFVVYSVVFALVVAFNKVVFGFRVNGRDHLRAMKGGFFLISNHTLYLDPAIVAHAIFPRRTYFSALAETFERPFIGGFIRLLGAFPLPTRSCMRRIMPAVEWALRRGRCVHFFPEGELTHYNQDPVEFSEGVFWLAERYDVPVVPVTLVLSDRTLLGIRLPRPLIQVTVEIGEALTASEFALGISRKQAIRQMAIAAREQVSQSIHAIQ